MRKFVAPRGKTHAYLMEYNKEYKKVKGTNKCVIKPELMFGNYKNCMLNNKIILKKQQAFRSDHHKVYTVQINKIVLSSNGKSACGTSGTSRTSAFHVEQVHLKYVKVK